ncbi:MAG: 4'-phosphopantetheinyl transferase superfamily protein [Desulfobacula sp.]|nr:4'-phosphopantetheinyl transferase superfamily protein [Desulfobacula sp.]
MVRQNQEIFVQTINFFHGKGPVFYASLPCGSGQRHHLVSGLWDHLVAVKTPVWMGRPDISKEAFPIRIIRGPLGKPQLLLGGHRGPAVSFCESGQNVWAALCGDEHDIGIDVAQPHEFQGKYPFNRVFHPSELQHAVKLLGEDLKKAAALLWSIKEAVAKALGCAFHLVDPRQMVVYPSISSSATGRAATESYVYDFPVGLSQKAVMRFPMAAGRALRVRSVFHEKMWLSIALLNWQQRLNDGADDGKSRFVTHRYSPKYSQKIQIGAL